MSNSKNRHLLLLDGIWDVGESVSPTDAPHRFDHRAPVPGLTHSAMPEFERIDEFRTPEYEVIKKLVGLESEVLDVDGVGISNHPRRHFWYRTQFDAPPERQVATLEVRKAQFGSEVWVNGVHVGTNGSGFTAARYDIREAVHWSSENEVLIRIGADPNGTPPGYAAVYDFEKTNWTPGVWDSVTAYFNDGVSITSTQVAPELNPRQIVVQTELRNTTSSAVNFSLTQSVRGGADDGDLAQTSQHLVLRPGENRTVLETIALADAELWSQDAPNLYVLTTSTGGDEMSTRFGMREFRFDTATKRAYLNGEPIFLRGGNVCLHRFFDDIDGRMLPWQDDWVRELLGPIPRRLGWNTLKFTVGPVPQRWLDIADEEGLLVLYEFPLWTLYPEMAHGYSRDFDTAVLRKEYEAWLRDSWNHPSVVYWAASLESRLPDRNSADIIADMRKLDLSHRPWGNSWNPPQGADDPHEYKMYLSNDPKFDMVQLQGGSGTRRAPFDPPTGHAGIITEFDWIWLNRDGSPTPYTVDLWDRIPYPRETADDRFKTLAYLLGGQVEYWRAHRAYAGVVYLSYLSQGWVVDNFRDVRTLTFHPHFEDFVGNAFKPLGVNIDFWQRHLELGTRRSFNVMVLNDSNLRVDGTLRLAVAGESGTTMTEETRSYELEPFGQMTYVMDIELPAIEGNVTLRAVAECSGAPSDVTISRRLIGLVPAGDPKIQPDAVFVPQGVQTGGQFDVGI